MQTKSGFERLSGDFNRGYTKAIQDITKVFKYVNRDLNHHKVRMNYDLVVKILDCFLKNREKFRDDMGISTGFIRVIRDEKGKWNCVEYYDRKALRKDLGYWVNMVDRNVIGNVFDNPELLGKG